MVLIADLEYITSKRVESEKGKYYTAHFMQEGGNPERFIVSEKIFNDLQENHVLGDAVKVTFEVFRSSRPDRNDFWRINAIN